MIKFERPFHRRRKTTQNSGFDCLLNTSRAANPSITVDASLEPQADELGSMDHECSVNKDSVVNLRASKRVRPRKQRNKSKDANEPFRSTKKEIKSEITRQLAIHTGRYGKHMQNLQKKIQYELELKARQSPTSFYIGTGQNTSHMTSIRLPPGFNSAMQQTGDDSLQQ